MILEEEIYKRLFEIKNLVAEIAFNKFISKGSRGEDLLQRTFQKCLEKLNTKKCLQKPHWLDQTKEQLTDHLIDEIDEWNREIGIDRERESDELLDIINTASMLRDKLLQEDKIVFLDQYKKDHGKI